MQHKLTNTFNIWRKVPFVINLKTLLHKMFMLTYRNSEAGISQNNVAKHLRDDKIFSLYRKFTAKYVSEIILKLGGLLCW